MGGAELKIARLEVENKRSAFEILPKAKDPKGEYKPKARIDAFAKRTRRVRSSVSNGA